MKHQKFIHILTIALFVLPLALGLILFAALPDNDFSEEEKREFVSVYCQHLDLPGFTVEKVLEAVAANPVR